MLRILLLISFCIISLCPTKASHIVGGDFSATWISANVGNTASSYRLKLTLFKDCETSTTQFDPQITIGIFDLVTNQRIDTLVMTLTSSGPLILATGNQCSPPPQICVDFGAYIADIEIANNPNGVYMAWERCCRNITVNNLVKPDDTGMTFYLELPDPALHNSTPKFKNDPLTYMCEEQPFSYNFDAVDPDGDSLVFALVTPVSGNIGYPQNANPAAVWASPISAPYADAIWQTGYGLGNICGGVPLAIDSKTGDMTATPDFFGKYAAAVECREFRNGIQIGMIRREIQFNVIICNSNTFPDVSFNAANKNISIYAGDTSCFTYYVQDNEADSLWLSISGDVFPGGSSGPPFATVTPKVGEESLSTDFCWLTSCDQARSTPYQVVFTSSDNGCPFPLTVNDTFNITVIPPPLMEGVKMLCMDLTIEDQTTVYYGLPTNPNEQFFRHYVVYRSVNGGSFGSIDTIFIQSKGFFIDNNAIDHDINDYCYYLVGQNICEFIGAPSDTICSKTSDNDQPNYIKSVTVLKGNQVQLTWNDFTNSEFSTVYIYRKINAPLELLQLVATLQNPTSNTWIDYNVQTASASYCYKIVSEDACGNLSPQSNIACTILLTGGSAAFEHTMRWTDYRYWRGGIEKYELYRKGARELNYSKLDGGGALGAYVDDQIPAKEGRYVYRVRAVEGFGGEGAESLSNELVLDQNPLVFLPNAFSPNDDYANDNWGAVTNFVRSYDLLVFNRYGQKVFHSDSPQKLWNGRYNGSPAPAGVYVYRLLIGAYGSDKIQKMEGSVTLLR